jgi:iron(III) transport system permease protein
VGPLGSIARTALWVASCLVVAAACLPGFYLLLRAGEVDARAWEVFFGGRTLELLGSTLSLAFAVTLAATLIALPLAWLTTLSDLPGRRAFTVLLCLPLAVPSFIHGYALLAAFGDGGLLDGWGAPRPRIYGFWGATFALTFSTFPFSFLAFRAALLRQDGSLLEAARSLGASPFEAFARVTLPQLLQAFRASGLLVAFYVLSDFGAVSLLQYDTFSRAIYLQLEGAFDRSLAALWSLGLMALAVLALGGSWFFGGAEGPTHAGRASRRPRRAHLGGHAVWGFAAVLGTLAAGVGVPVGVIVLWLTRAADRWDFERFWTAAVNSLWISLLAALVTVLCTLPLAWLSARRASSPLVRVLERAAYASYALPPIVVALSLVSFGIRAAPFLYGTFVLLVAAHVVRFAPQALGASRGAFLQLSPRLTEAGNSLGGSGLDVARLVAWPLLRPGLVAGGALVFLTTMKELPATLLLAPIGFSTLATQIWSATAEGYFAEAALPSLLLIALSSASVAFTLHREDSAGVGATG